MAAAGRRRCFAQAAATGGSTRSTSCARRRERWDGEGRRLVVAAWTRGSRERLAHLLREHGFRTEAADDWAAVRRTPAGSVALVTLGLERGFVAEDPISAARLLSEQDLLGERISRPPRRRKRADQFIAEATEIAEGDLVVHQDHGIGRYDGLVTLTVTDAPHDCLRLLYDGDDKLFLPVENIEMLSRFGSEGAGVALDKLGGTSWQTRKARMKQRIRDMAGELIRIAAERQLHDADDAWRRPRAAGTSSAPASPSPRPRTSRAPSPTCWRTWPSGRPMDRLICGDVGFGKTEVALRAAFVAAMSGAQVAVVVPTTLLARQHFRTFSRALRRTAGEGGAALAHGDRQGSGRGAARPRRRRRATSSSARMRCWPRAISFADLGLLVVDEEQHFGVAHKEKLKALKADVHVLTLTATPIPRTLQLALTGVREMSLIATPPVDRLAVRTFIMPFDARGDPRGDRSASGSAAGRCSAWCRASRTSAAWRSGWREIVPEARIAQAHGRLAPTELERVMTEFGDGQIRHPALDQHRRERAGHAGGEHAADPSRRHVRAGAAVPVARPRRARQAARLCLSDLAADAPAVGGGGEAADGDADAGRARRRLHAGLARSRHSRRRQSAGRRADRAISARSASSSTSRCWRTRWPSCAPSAGASGVEARDWTPNIALGLPVLIPETYVRDLPVRLGLYRRIGALASDAETEAMAAELVDRFGPLPDGGREPAGGGDAEARCAARPAWRSWRPGRRAWC